MAKRTRIFIASAGEDLAVAHDLAEVLGRDFHVTPWDSGVFGLSQYRLESLTNAIADNDVGVVVFSPTDVVTIRGKTQSVPRDNVVFELGMMVAAFGRQRSYIVLPEGADVHLLSDLHGIEPAFYDPSHRNRLAALGTVANKIKRAIRSAENESQAGRQRQVQYGLFGHEMFPKFTNALMLATRVDLVFIHSRRLLDSITDVLEEFLARDNVALRIFLPDLSRPDLVEQLAKRFDDGPHIPGFVAQAYLRFAGLMKAFPGRITVRLFRCVPSYSCYRFDDSMFVALYPMSRKRRASPTFHCAVESPLGQFVSEDMEVLTQRAESRNASKEVLMQLSRKFAICV